MGIGEDGSEGAPALTLPDAHPAHGRDGRARVALREEERPAIPLEREQRPDHHQRHEQVQPQLDGHRHGERRVAEALRDRRQAVQPLEDEPLADDEHAEQHQDRAERAPGRPGRGDAKAQEDDRHRDGGAEVGRNRLVQQLLGDDDGQEREREHHGPRRDHDGRAGRLGGGCPVVHGHG
jgi:hypothetical protein